MSQVRGVIEHKGNKMTTDGILTGARFAAGLRTLNITHEGFARYSGVSIGTIAKYASPSNAEKRVPPRFVYMLNDLMYGLKPIPEYITRQRRTKEQIQEQRDAIIKRIFDTDGHDSIQDPEDWRPTPLPPLEKIMELDRQIARDIVNQKEKDCGKLATGHDGGALPDGAGAVQHDAQGGGAVLRGDGSDEHEMGERNEQHPEDSGDAAGLHGRSRPLPRS